MKYVSKLFLVLTIALLSSSCNSQKVHLPQKENSSAQEDLYKFKKEGELTFTKANGDYITTIDIEIADTEVKRARGLMFREHLGENQGMLFVFPEESYQAFWMKNTVIPLDMIFVNKNRTIVTIHKNTTPYSEQTYPSSKPAIYVVEVNAGFTDKYNIEVGDKIAWRIIR